ncbi:MAG: hypothetical protein HY819_03410 [Acidobacteria bacterium]|nr:hypothetical protein [Acidobacteriota bacterium]
MKNCKTTALYVLVLILLTSMGVNAMQNPNKKKLVDTKESKQESKAINLDEEGNILISVEKLQNELSIFLIEQKINSGQASLLENQNIRIAPAFPKDCNTFTLLWLLEGQKNLKVNLSNLDSVEKSNSSENK